MKKNRKQINNDIQAGKPLSGRRLVILGICLIAVLFLASIVGYKYQFVKKIKKVDAKLQLLSTAVLFYHQDHGAFPENLYQITTPTAYFYGIPLDPFSDQGSIYAYKKPEDDSYRILYSFGPDNDDDHGENIYDPTNGYNRSDGDMIRKAEKPESVF